MQTHYPITLKCGTHKGGVIAHHDTKFGYNPINGRKVINKIFTKNNTNMLSGYTANDKKLKIDKEIV